PSRIIPLLTLAVPRPESRSWCVSLRSDTDCPGRAFLGQGCEYHWLSNVACIMGSKDTAEREGKPSGKSWMCRGKIPGMIGRDLGYSMPCHKKIVPFLAGSGVTSRCGFGADRSICSLGFHARCRPTSRISHYECPNHHFSITRQVGKRGTRKDASPQKYYLQDHD